jgi:hypothetical protein
VLPREPPGKVPVNRHLLMITVDAFGNEKPTCNPTATKLS